MASVGDTIGALDDEFFALLDANGIGDDKKDDDDDEEKGAPWWAWLICCVAISVLLASLIVFLTQGGTDDDDSMVTFAPTLAPTFAPTMAPTLVPTFLPTRQPTGQPTAHPTRQPTSQPTMVPTAQPTFDPTDCCPQDPFAYADSPYGSPELTLCGTFDYNCDGIVDEYPCCLGATSIVNGHDARVIYNVESQCNETGVLSTSPDDLCGACVGEEVLFGWECIDPVPDRKRFIPACPEECENFVSVTMLNPPNVSECALFVDHCVGSVGGDGETCCIVIGA